MLCPSPRSITRLSLAVLLACAYASRGLAQETFHWRVSTTPSLSVRGPNAQNEFGQIAGVLRHGKGIVVADASTSQLHFFDHQGKFRATSGRDGDGPGEYRRIWGIGSYRSDSIWVADQTALMVTILDLDGRFGRRFRIEAPLARPDAIYYADLPHVLGALSDGTLIVETPYSLPLDVSPGDRWYEARLIRLSATGQFLNNVGTFEAIPVNVRTSGVRGDRQIPLFAGPFPVAVIDSGILIGGGSTYRVRLVSASGGQATVAIPSPGPSVTSEHVRVLRQNQKEQEANLERRRQLPQALVPARFPPYVSIVPSPAGQLWLQGPDVPGTAVTQCTIVQAGRIIAQVNVPTRFRAYSFSGDRILGVWRDNDDVEHLREYSLVRASSR